MVGQLCQCNKENKEVPSVLDEPIVLHRQGDGPAPIGPSPPLSGSLSSSSSSSGLNTLVENGDTGGRGGLTWQAHCEFVESF